MVEPCGPKSAARQKLLGSLKDAIKLVEEECSNGRRAPMGGGCVPDCPCPCNVRAKQAESPEGGASPPLAMVRRRKRFGGFGEGGDFCG